MDHLTREVEDRVTRIYEAGLGVADLGIKPKMEDENRLEDLRVELTECLRLVEKIRLLWKVSGED